MNDPLYFVQTFDNKLHGYMTQIGLMEDLNIYPFAIKQVFKKEELKDGRLHYAPVSIESARKDYESNKS